MVGTPLSGVTTGSVITGEVAVDLAQLPPDDNPGSYGAEHNYSGGKPGYIFQFSTGQQTFTYNSINAAGDGGLTPGVFQFQRGDPSHFLNFQARDAGNPYAVLLQFEDYTEPLTLVRGDYFPEDVNLETIPERARLYYFDNFGTAEVIAQITALTMTIEKPTPASLLIYRVNASTLSARHKQLLLRLLGRADEAYANGQCRLGQKRLRHFQQSVLAQVRKKDPVLAAHLAAGAQTVIDGGCSAKPGIIVY